MAGGGAGDAGLARGGSAQEAAAFEEEHGRLQVAGGGAGSTDYLVTDSGVKFPIPAPSVLALFGYTESSQVTLPATVLALLPTGPSLDPAELVNGGVITPPRQQAGCG